MIHDYENPNTCYAIGDAWNQMVGTAVTVRQPSAGVFEEVSSVTNSDTTDGIFLRTSSNSVELVAGAVCTNVDGQDSTSWRGLAENMAIKISNTVYIEKTGTSARCVWTGVQVDA